ncbi:ArsR/SmtB family transcription factor [Aquabacter spiritensis]|uniref:ArsR family transcriptional regulator n=1 Tax=Aquabacter spiritensis TaxID=933073 RepID=A0A4R3LRC5_9HYPH|nr:metalloregulator ArsR/SmtB family transcription factor [Aquabacter spiritensis]TCT02276.1 ArsR family transcriptional regulator [Aquabacter spiritensis]
MPGLDATFAALADPTRRAILARLAEGEATVGELAAPIRLTAPTVSKHLRVLERAALIEVRKEAQRRHCRLVRAPLDAAQSWIARTAEFWDQSLEKLDALAAAPEAARPARRRKR